MSKLHNWEVVMLILNKAKTLLRDGNLQEQRNKDFTLRLTTSFMLVLLAGFLSGLISYKVLADPASSATLEHTKNTHHSIKSL